MVIKIGLIALILIFGALFAIALIDGNSTGIMSTGLVFAAFCAYSAFELVPALRRWNNKGRAQSPPR